MKTRLERLEAMAATIPDPDPIDEGPSDEERRRADLIAASMSDATRAELICLFQDGPFDHPLLKAFVSYRRAVWAVYRGYFGERKPDPEYAGPIRWFDEFQEYFTGAYETVTWFNCQTCGGALPFGYVRELRDFQPGGPKVWQSRIARRFETCPYCGK